MDATEEHDAELLGFDSPLEGVEEYREMNRHFVRLENLEPDKTYYYVICDSEGVGRLWFRTATNCVPTTSSGSTPAYSNFPVMIMRAHFYS